jgi:hypothetical protein
MKEKTTRPVSLKEKITKYIPWVVPCVPWAVLVVALCLFGYLSYEVGRIAAYEGQNPQADYLTWKSATVQTINQNSQNINAIVQYLNAHPIK